MRKVLMAAAAVALALGFAANADARSWQGTLIEGGSVSVGAGASQHGGGTTTTSGTTFGGAGATSDAGVKAYKSGSGFGSLKGSKAANSGSVSGSTYQTSSTNGPAVSGSYSKSAVGVCAGPTCTLP